MTTLIHLAKKTGADWPVGEDEVELLETLDSWAMSVNHYFPIATL